MSIHFLQGPSASGLSPGGEGVCTFRPYCCATDQFRFKRARRVVFSNDYAHSFLKACFIAFCGLDYTRFGRLICFNITTTASVHPSLCCTRQQLLKLANA